MLVDEGRIAVEASTPVGELSSESIKGDWDLTSDPIDSISSAVGDSDEEVCALHCAPSMFGTLNTCDCVVLGFGVLGFERTGSVLFMLMRRTVL